ncbi:MAG: DNA topoisomerase IV subunit A [Candidatus Bathyarchaeota archaeon]
MTEETIEESERQKNANEANLNQLGALIYDQIQNQEFPWIMMQSRSSDNVYYDEDVRQFVLGDKTVRRHSRNVRNIRPFTQFLWTAWFARELVRLKKTSTLREVYYSARGQRDIQFKDQSDSDYTITDLEVALNRPRESFNIYPKDRGAIYGDLNIEYTFPPAYEGRVKNLTDNPDGAPIGRSLTSSKFLDTTADKVIVIEKDAMFARFVEENVHENFNALLMQTEGIPSRSARMVIRRLNQDKELPIYILTDGDPWGLHIAMVIISGSAVAAHLRGLTTPDAHWIGVWGSDVRKYKIPTEPLSETDLKRLHELKEDPRYDDELWLKEIEIYLEMERKAELEAFSAKGLTYIVDKYLPDKIEAV